MTEAGVTGIILAHKCAFGSGELKTNSCTLVAHKKRDVIIM